jgi:hypothetical protein
MGSLRLLHVEASAAALAERSRRVWREQALGAHEAELLVGMPSDEAIVLGAYQRRAEVGDAARRLPVFARGSGGGATEVGPGTVWLQLSLGSPGALVDATQDQLLNRYVRPLLRALTRVLKVPASYFGRDWVSAGKHPVALVSVAHECSTHRAMFEAIVAVSTPLSFAERASYAGKPPKTLEDLVGAPLEVQRVAREILEAYATLGDAVDGWTEAANLRDNDSIEVPDEPAWSAVRSEAIGLLGAGVDCGGKLRVGGELMASRDAMGKLEARIHALSEEAQADAIGHVVNETLGADGVALFGIRTLTSVRDVINEARQPSICPKA